MLVSEFEKRIKNIDSRLCVEESPSIRIYCLVIRSRYDPNEYEQVAILGCDGHISTFYSGLEQLSNENQRKLLLACVDMAMTPLDRRKDEHKWNVIVGNDGDSAFPFLIWAKNIDKSTLKFRLKIGGTQELEYASYIFTDSEYKELIEHIKTLPDGDWQAKVAEHGKTEVKGELK